MHALAFGTALRSDAVEFPAAAALPIREAFGFCECRTARMGDNTFVQMRVGWFESQEAREAIAEFTIHVGIGCGRF